MNTSDKKNAEVPFCLCEAQRLLVDLLCFVLVQSGAFFKAVEFNQQNISPRKRSPEDFDAAFFCSSNFFFLI